MPSWSTVLAPFFFQPSWLAVFLLVFLRSLGLMIAAPVFGQAGVPPQVRVGLALFLPLLLMPSLAQVVADQGETLATMLMQQDAWPRYVGAAVGEVALGLTLGWLMSLILSTVRLVGQLLDSQMGLSAAQLIDPTFGVQQPLLGNLLWLFTILLLLLADGHHFVIAVLAQSLTRTPPAALAFDPLSARVVVDAMAWTFVTAGELAAPLLALLLLVNAAFGLLGRAVPQVNVFLLEMPAQTLVGLAALLLLIAWMPEAAPNLFAHMEEVVRSWLETT